MNIARQDLWKKLMSEVQNSPMVSAKFEGNFFHFKLDYLLPFGECHYSRIFAKLLYLKECLGIIKPGDILLETTSGSGGRAAAAVATFLGYKIKIAVPAGGEQAREEAIVKAGAELILTPKEEYVNGFPNFIKEYLTEHPEVKYINHAMGDIYGKGKNINGVAINAFYPFIEETVESGVQPDIIFSPLGNGTTTFAMAQGFKSFFRKVKVIGFESVASAYCHRQKYPGKYENVFDIKPDIFTRQDLPGTTNANPAFPVPALEAAIHLLDGVGLVTSNYIDDLFLRNVGFEPRKKSDQVIKWDDLTSFPVEKFEEFGRTGRAALAVAIEYARKHKIIEENFLIPVFDASWHYDS